MVDHGSCIYMVEDLLTRLTIDARFSARSIVLQLLSTSIYCQASSSISMTTYRQSDKCTNLL